MADPSAAGPNSVSKWHDYDAIDLWGWEDETPRRDREKDGSSIDGLDGIVGSSPGIEVAWRHSNAYQGHETPADAPPGAKYPPTQALYANWYWPELGVIYAAENWGPAYRIQQDLEYGEGWDKDVDQPPQLQRWSDIVFLTLQDLAAEEPKTTLSIKWVYRHFVVNPDTRNMLAYVLKLYWPMEEGRPPQWPAERKITPDMKGFEALLNTPNIRGIVWLLVQHREALGAQTIKSITLGLERTTLK